ncbi:hypothetical protein LTR95_004902 [Oleoguttula sp. CCFEE 5521]
MAGLTKFAEEEICGGALFPHGAGWFCEMETMTDFISNYHSLDFIAEDVNTGLSMMRLKKSIGFDATCVLETEIPTTVFGKGPHPGDRYNGSQQRLLAASGLARPRINVPHPVVQIRSCRRWPDLQPTFWGAIAIPLYKQLYYFVSVIGGIRALVIYVGGHQRPLTVKQMIEVGDERVLRLDPRWATNEAFPANEGEVLRLAKEGVNDGAKPEIDAKPMSRVVDEQKTLSSIMAHLPQMCFSRSQKTGQTSLETLPVPPRAILVS